MADVLVDWASADSSVGRSLRFKGKLREVGEDLTSRVILGAEHWLADKVDIASYEQSRQYLHTHQGGGEPNVCGEIALRILQEN